MWDVGPTAGEEIDLELSAALPQIHNRPTAVHEPQDRMTGLNIRRVKHDVSASPERDLGAGKLLFALELPIPVDQDRGHVTVCLQR
jgi:hypothetical protein